MGTAAVKWSPGNRTVEPRDVRKARRDPAARAAAHRQPVIRYAELEQVRERGRGITPPRTLARVEHALFVLILATVGYLWLAQAMGAF